MPEDMSTEVWYIPQTKEWFLTYEDYLARMDYYRGKKFVCEITGNSCLTFFDAQKSELVEIEEVEKNFPEALREHILRFLQFNRISRLDQLVDKVYSIFKNDYFPGETIFIKGITHVNNQGEIESINESVKQRGTIREKVQYGQSDNITTKYLVVRLNDSTQSIVTNDQISRDRNHFTKWLIKTFIKMSVCRSHKVGAPWVVKDKYCTKYRIPREYPEDLIQYMDSTPTGEILYEPLNQQNSSKHEETPLSESLQIMEFKLSSRDRKKFPNHYLPENIFEENDLLSEKATLAMFGIQPGKKNIVDDLQIRFDVQNPRPNLHPFHYPKNSAEWNKHIVDELMQEMNESDNQDEIANYLSEINRLSATRLGSIQEALQTWAFINIYHSVLGIDTFTFDDFVYAMGWNYDQYQKYGRCELVDEIWCAVLGAVVSNEIPKHEVDDDEIFGLLINVPSKDYYIKQEKIANNGSEDGVIKEDTPAISNGKTKESETPDRGSESEHEDKTLKSEDDDESVEGRDSKNKDSEAEDDNNNDENEQTSGSDDEDTETFNHNSYTIMNHRKVAWHDRLRKRNFKDGNWHTILLGVLSLFEHIPQYNPTIQKIFEIMAPKSMPATASTALTQFYEALDIDLRFQALKIITDFLVSGTLVRKYIDDSLDASTNIRRSRLDNIRDYKVQLDVAQKSNISIHEQLSKERASTPLLKNENGEDITTPLPKRPRLNFNAVDMTEEEAKLAEKDPVFASTWNRRKEALLKLDAIRKENHEFEARLIELDCQRVKMLGKDRLLNRYWWFENNGLPTFRRTNKHDDGDGEYVKPEEGEEDRDGEMLTDTFLMGRLWVQGPSNNDLKVHFNSDFDSSQKFNETLHENERTFIEQEMKESNVEHPIIAMEKVELENGESVKEMNFESVPDSYKRTVLDLYGVDFKSNEILLDNDKIIDHQGALTNSSFISRLTPFQRKAIEECPNMLVNGSNWTYLDTPEEINKLLQWLNPWGKRESGLRKELLNIKDALASSMESRRKAMWIDDVPADEVRILSKIDKIKQQIDKLENESSNGGDGENKPAEEDDDEEVTGRKRVKRKATSSRKRKKLETTQEILEQGDITDLKQHLEKLSQILHEKKRDIELTRVLEWVNSTALENFEKSLYEGGDKIKSSRRARPLL
jgi:hypothetical protein